MSKEIAVVLNSGGVDSTTAVGLAVDLYGKRMLLQLVHIMDKSTVLN